MATPAGSQGLRDWACTVIAGLGRAAFTDFIGGLLASRYGEGRIERIPGLGPLPCFARRMLGNSQAYFMGYNPSDPPVGLYIIDHLPVHILTNPGREELRSPKA
jgi:hypothetical protein